MQWPEFDGAVLGGHYTGHHSDKLATAVSPVSGAEKHPILAGLSRKEFPAGGGLYQTSPLAEGAVPLLMGRAGDKTPEPVAWTFERKGGGRAFYTSMGHVSDFKEEAFVKLLKNGILWAVGK